MAAGFLGYESAELEKALFTIIPAPCESGATYVNGQALAPRAIIDASTRIEAFDEESGLNLIERDAIHCVAPENAPNGSALNSWLSGQINQALEATTVPVILGGDGTISFTAIKTLAEHAAKSKQELSVLHLDAHADLNSLDGGENNLSGMRKVFEMTPHNVRLCQLGVRSLSQNAFNLIANDENAIDCFFMSDLRHSNDDDWQEDVVSGLSSPVYVSIDLSVFDPSVIPNVGNPEPGGFMWAQIVRLLSKVANHRRIAAFDIVELCPRPEMPTSNYVAARLVYKLMNYIVAGGKILKKSE